jgi:uncharacterized protein (DUF362 family)
MKKTPVTSFRINNNYKQAFDKTIQSFPDVVTKIKECKNIFLKISIDHLYDFQYTNLELLQSILEYMRQENPLAKIYVMENNIYGNFTRLLVNVLGIVKLIKSYKAKFLYLDEKKAITVSIGSPEEQVSVQFPQILKDKLIDERKKSFYLNLASLKTHYQLKVAAGLANQAGLLNRRSFRFIYSSLFHQTLVNLRHYIKPDFTIVDANYVLAHGSMPPKCLIKKYSEYINRLIAGVDPIAVDRVAIEMAGYSPLEINHLKLAIAQNYGEGDLDNIEIEGELPSNSSKIPYSHELYQLPQRMDIIFGKKRDTGLGCLGLALQFAQIIFKDFLGNRGFSIICGQDFSENQLFHLREPVIVLGSKACDEVSLFIKENYQKHYYIDHCDNINQIIAVLVKVMGGSKYNIIGVNPLTVWKYLLFAKFNGLKYKLPTIARKTKSWKIKKIHKAEISENKETKA